MSKGLTTEQKAEVAKSQVKSRTLLTLTLNNEAQDVVLILENDTLSSFVYNGETYPAAMVQRGKIESAMEGGCQSCNIKISNINQAYSQIIANQGDVLTNSRCSIDEVIFYDEKDNLLLESGYELLLENSDSVFFEKVNSVISNAVNIFEGYVNNVVLTETTFSFDVERVLGGYSTQSPNTTYDVNCQWGFKDERCQYSGEETTCDKTLTACQARNNETRFGGYPSIPAQLVIKG